MAKAAHRDSPVRMNELFQAYEIVDVASSATTNLNRKIFPNNFAFSCISNHADLMLAQNLDKQSLTSFICPDILKKFITAEWKKNKTMRIPEHDIGCNDFAVSPKEKNRT